MANVEAAFRNIHQDLLDGCKTGDQKAQFQIYKLYYKAMYNTSLRIVNDTMEAEDIMQESFLSAFEKIETYSGTVSFGAWLKKIVINRSLDTLSRRKAIFEDIESHTGIKDESDEDLSRREELDIKIEEVKEAITKQDIHDLIARGLIVRKRDPEHSRGRARFIKYQKRKGRRR